MAWGEESESLCFCFPHKGVKLRKLHVCTTIVAQDRVLLHLARRKYNLHTQYIYQKLYVIWNIFTRSFMQYGKSDLSLCHLGTQYIYQKLYAIWQRLSKDECCLWPSSCCWVVCWYRAMNSSRCPSSISFSIKFFIAQSSVRCPWS